MNSGFEPVEFSYDMDSGNYSQVDLQQWQDHDFLSSGGQGMVNTFPHISQMSISQTRSVPEHVNNAHAGAITAESSSHYDGVEGVLDPSLIHPQILSQPSFLQKRTATTEQDTHHSKLSQDLKNEISYDFNDMNGRTTFDLPQHKTHHTQTTSASNMAVRNSDMRLQQSYSVQSRSGHDIGIGSSPAYPDQISYSSHLQSPYALTRSTTPAMGNLPISRTISRRFPESEPGLDKFLVSKSSANISSSATPSGIDSPFSNNLLGMFADADVPLRIIDNYFGKNLPQALVTELAAALNSHSGIQPSALFDKLQTVQDERSGNVKPETGSLKRLLPRYVQPPSLASGFSTPGAILKTNHPDDHDRQLAVPRFASQPRSGTSTPGLRPKPKGRSQMNKNFESEMHYDSLPDTIRGWSPDDEISQNTRPGPKLFEYTKKGELIPGRRYTVEELGQYLSRHPLHSIAGGPKNSGLRLWIQTVPADAKKRYATEESAKCRFENCPTFKGTIRTGEFRVCFDEEWFPELDLHRDPFYNAGYVHLYCLEKHFNLYDLFQSVNLHPDTREFPREEKRSCMSITRDHESMLDVCWQYLEQTEERRRKGIASEEHDFFATSLTKALTQHHIDNESTHVRQQKLERDGFDRSQHLGNLELVAQHRQKVLLDKKSGLMTPSPAQSSRDRGSTPQKRRRVAPLKTSASEETSQPRRSTRLTTLAMSPISPGQTAVESGRRSPPKAEKQAARKGVTKKDDFDGLVEDDEDDVSDYEDNPKKRRRI